MAKELVLTSSDVHQYAPILDGFFDYACKALAEICVENPDQEKVEAFIAHRNSCNRILSDFKRKIADAEVFVKMGNEFLKNVYNFGTAEQLPENVTWEKQSCTYAFKDNAGVEIAKDLIERGMCSAESLFAQLKVEQIAKACGMKNEGIVEKFVDAIEKKPKARVLKIK